MSRELGTLLASAWVCMACGESPGAGPAQRMTGFLHAGPEAPRLVPCDEGAGWIVTGPALPDLITLHRRLSPEQDSVPPIFVDVLAQPSEPAPESSLHVLEVRRAAFEGFGCRSVDDALLARAGGNEPFWSIEVRPDDATFSTPEGDVDLVSGPLERIDGGWRLSGTDASGGTFTFHLREGGCSDSMSGAWSHAAATLTLGAETYSGCGFLGAAGEP